MERKLREEQSERERKVKKEGREDLDREGERGGGGGGVICGSNKIVVCA